MNKTMRNALVSVFHKDGLDNIIRKLHEAGVNLYSTGGTQSFIESLGIPCNAVENLTSYPSILGGRVKTLHPKVFGGILARRENDQDLAQLEQYEIPQMDLVIVDLYPFEATVKATTDEQTIIEKIDIGGVSLIRAGAKNFKDVVIVASKNEYGTLENLLDEQKGETTLEQRRMFAAKAFQHCAHYDVAIAQYFTNNTFDEYFQVSVPQKKTLRYGENPHQQAQFFGNLNETFEQLHGKELSFNNLVDTDAAVQLVQEFTAPTFAVIKHTNVCGIATRPTLKEAWDAALAGDSESAFGGVLACNQIIDKETAEAVSEIFFEILVAQDFTPEAMEVLTKKKNRMLLKQLKPITAAYQYKNVMNGALVQDSDLANYQTWTEAGARETTPQEKADLEFANIVCKHLKSNAIALVKNQQLIGKGCGQTSRIDALRHAVEKAKQFKFDLNGAVLASDAFFPFNDCVKMGREQGITAFIQPGGSIRDNDSVEYCKENGLALVMSGMRHFKH
jgi:phosphoribosylaminoimidazolecarboxamide formyltransferase/IMP cyclohydrolase